MIYLEHPEHGKKFADTEQEAKNDEIHGWVRVPYDFVKWQPIRDQDEKQELLKIAKEKGIKLDGRMKLENMKAALNGDRQYHH